jgi:hypothetical protein
MSEPNFDRAKSSLSRGWKNDSETDVRISFFSPNKVKGFLRSSSYDNHTKIISATEVENMRSGKPKEKNYDK